MLHITKAYRVMSVEQAYTVLQLKQFRSRDPCNILLLVFELRQAFKAAGKVVQPGKYSESVSCQSYWLGSAKLEEESIIKSCLHLKTWKADY